MLWSHKERPLLGKGSVKSSPAEATMHTTIKEVLDAVISVRPVLCEIVIT
jgi:hypothetical protein